MQQTWIIEARKHIGLREVAGATHAPAILQMWRDIKRGGIKSDETPWCAAFVGACLERVGITSTRFESAASYMTWGRRLAQPVPGCIAVFTRTGGGHVGFVVGQDKDGNLQVLGGNQGDMVKVSTFGRARVTSYRWPSGLPVPLQEGLPVVAAAALSTKET